MKRRVITRAELEKLLARIAGVDELTLAWIVDADGVFEGVAVFDDCGIPTPIHKTLDEISGR